MRALHKLGYPMLRYLDLFFMLRVLHVAPMCLLQSRHVNNISGLAGEQWLWITVYELIIFVNTGIHGSKNHLHVLYIHVQTFQRSILYLLFGNHIHICHFHHFMNWISDLTLDDNSKWLHPVDNLVAAFMESEYHL
jgi:hypothetical protein